MNWLIDLLRSSLGKKLMMSLTGLAFSLFLMTHLAGNLSIFAGRDAFNRYAESLHGFGPLLTVAELGLLFFAFIHIVLGLILFAGNLNARPVRYAARKNAGGRSVGSATMPYTGLLLLVFVVVHLFNFHFVDKTDRTIYDIVSAAFSSPGYVIFYLIAMGVAAVHVSHGFWSAFQTLGADHPKYTPALRGAGIVFSLIVGVGFGAIPIYFLFLV
jgi:succinate dehydrogenase / fumarate reductase, cytochrome b subunit